MRFSRRQLIAYLALAAVVVAVGVRYLVLDEPAPEAGGERLVLAPAASPAPAAAAAGAGGAAAARPSPAPEVLVHVCGAVRRPGVVRLPQGSRVADALEVAGGATAQGNLAAVNLAARVADGQQIVVPEKGGGGEPGGSAAGGGTAAGGGAAGGSAGATPPGAPVNLNTASATELEALPGVGPATAQKIVDYRTAQGGFKSVEELKNVPGIGDAKFAALKDAVAI